jgi:GcrA cell cycle regulator
MTSRDRAPTKLKTLELLQPNECRWPIGDPQLPDFHFCGEPKNEGHPYCLEHVGRARTPGRPRTITFRSGS